MPEGPEEANEQGQVHRIEMRDQAKIRDMDAVLPEKMVKTGDQDQGALGKKGKQVKGTPGDQEHIGNQSQNDKKRTKPPQNLM